MNLWQISMFVMSHCTLVLANDGRKYSLAEKALLNYVTACQCFLLPDTVIM